MKRILLVLSALMCAIPVAQAETLFVDEILAVVNDEVITRGDFSRALEPVYARLMGMYEGEDLNKVLRMAQFEMLDRIIENKLIAQEAKRQEIEVRDSEIAERIAEVRAKFDSQEAFEDALHEQGVNLWDLEEKHRENIMAKKLVDREVTAYVSVPLTAIAAYYHGHPEEFEQQAAWHVQHILIKTGEDRTDEEVQAKIAAVEQGLSRGEEFSALAEQFSDGSHAASGGDMGFVKKGTLLSELEDMLSSLGVGDVGGPIQTAAGYNFIKVVEKRDADTVSFADAQPSIQKKLWKKQYDKQFREWITELREKAYIVVKAR